MWTLYSVMQSTQLFVCSCLCKMCKDCKEQDESHTRVKHFTAHLLGPQMCVCVRNIEQLYVKISVSVSETL